MKRILWLIFLLVMVSVLLITCKSKRGGKMVAVVETSMGNFEFTLFNEDAPNTVKNFVDLAEKKFYDGLTFHRVVEGFVIQGGCPQGDGTGGPGHTIAAEFNDHKHVLGTVAMARGRDINSAGSQFYVCLDTISHLDKQYTVFGKVTSGIEIVQKIGSVPVDMGHRPVEPVHILKITIDR